MLNAPGLAGWEPAKAPLQQPQHQGDAFFATTLLAAFLAAFLATFLAAFLATFLAAFLAALLAALLATFLAAFLKTFGEHFLIEATFLEIGVGESEHGLNLLSGQLGQTINQNSFNQVEHFSGR